jgi:hypothetical protein
MRGLLRVRQICLICSLFWTLLQLCNANEYVSMPVGSQSTMMDGLFGADMAAGFRPVNQISNSFSSTNAEYHALLGRSYILWC